MATIQISLTIEVTEDGEKTERIEPPGQHVDVGGQLGRHVIELSTDPYKTLETGGIAPGWWYFRNISDTADVAISFGVNDDIVLKPMRFALLWTTQIPLAKGIGAPDARLAYTVGED